MAAEKGVAHHNYAHGLSKHPLHKVWSSIKERCYKTDSRDYVFYGSRGISMGADWKLSFISFYEWSMANGYEKGLTIDRIDNNGNYEPSNCRWVSRAVQNRNMSTNRIIEVDGVKKCLTDWLGVYEISTGTFYSRVKKGMSDFDALTTPLTRCKRKLVTK